MSEKEQSAIRGSFLFYFFTLIFMHPSFAVEAMISTVFPPLSPCVCDVANAINPPCHFPGH